MATKTAGSKQPHDWAQTREGKQYFEWKAQVERLLEKVSVLNQQWNNDRVKWLAESAPESSVDQDAIDLIANGRVSPSSRSKLLWLPAIVFLVAVALFFTRQPVLMFSALGATLFSLLLFPIDAKSRADFDRDRLAAAQQRLDQTEWAVGALNTKIFEQFKRETEMAERDFLPPSLLSSLDEYLPKVREEIDASLDMKIRLSEIRLQIDGRSI